MIGINRMSDRERWINPDKRERERERERWKRHKLSMRRTGLRGSRNNKDLKNDRNE